MEQRKILTAQVNGLKVKFRPFTETQLALLGRAAGRIDEAQRTENQALAITCIDNILTIIFSAIMEIADKDAINDQMMAGELEIVDLITSLEAARVEDAVGNAPALADQKPRTRRGAAK